MKSIQSLILSCLFSVVWVSAGTAEVHYVDVVDHSFSPQNLTVNEGDTVIWLWQDDMHDVVGGTEANPRPDIMDSGLLDAGAEYEVTFSRNKVNQFPVSDNSYEYFCTPHWIHGMIGSITVNRPDKPFSAQLDGIQSGSASSATGECEAILEGEEAVVTVSCTYNVPNPISAEIRAGSFGSASGDLICSLALAELSSGVDCNVNQQQADALWEGEVYIVVNSSDYPGGELRGQLVHRDGSASISGRVQLPGGHPISNVSIHNGLTSSSTNTFGLYSIDSSNGVHTLTAERSGFNIVANSDTNPVFVNNEPVAGKDFTASFDSESECALIDLAPLLEPLIGDFTRLRNLTRRSLRQFRNFTGQRRRANRLIARVNDEYDAVFVGLDERFPSASTIVTCDLCTSVSNSTFYTSKRIQARRWRRMLLRHGRLAAANGLPEIRRMRQQTRSRRLLRSIRRGLNQFPESSYQC